MNDHKNLLQKKHGDPSGQKFFRFRPGRSQGTSERHVGDLGNIFTLSNDYPTQVFKMDQAITLQEGKENTILGRAVVVHGKKWKIYLPNTAAPPQI